MQFFENAGLVIAELARGFVMMLLTVPLLIASLVGEAVDIFAGIKDMPPGRPIYAAIDYGEAPPIEFDGYICFDLDRMYPGEYGKYYDYYTLYENIFAMFYPFQAPFQDMDDSHKAKIERLWDHVPAVFKDGKRMRDYIANYVNAAYGANPAIIDYDNNTIYAEAYAYGMETYYYIPGDAVSRAGMFPTPREAVDDYTRRHFYNSIMLESPIKPYITSGAEKDLGSPVGLLTLEEAMYRSYFVNYYGIATRAESLLGEHRFFWNGNDMHNWMHERGYTDFILYSWQRGENVASFKYYMENPTMYEHNHTFSIQLYYSVKPLWRAYIDHSPKYVVDMSKGKADIERYTPEVQALIGANPGMNPGSDSMYKKIADTINDGRDLDPVIIDNNVNVLQLFWGQSAISYTFWGITLIAVVLCIGFSIFAVIRSMGDSGGDKGEGEGEKKRTLGQVVGSIGKAMLTFLLIPVLMIVAINLAGAVMRQTSFLLDEANGAGDGGFTSAIFASALTEDSLRIPITGSKATDLELYRDKVKSGSIAVGDYLKYFDPFHMYIVPSAVTAWFCVVIMFMTLLIFIRRIMEVLLLYISSPFFAASIPLDDGAKFKSWREMFISKMVSGFSSLIMLKLYLLLLPVIWSSSFTLLANGTYDMILRLILTAGGMYTVYSSQTLLSNVLDVRMAGDEKESAAFINQRTFMRGVSGVQTGYRNLKREVRAFRKVYSKTKATQPDYKREEFERDEKRWDKVTERTQSLRDYKKDFDKTREGLGDLKRDLETPKSQTLEDFLNNP